MNIKKIRLIVNLISLVLTLSTSIFVVYSWYIGGTFAPPITIQSANVDSKTTLSKGIDFDYDGYPDLSYDDSGLTLDQKKNYFTVSNMYFKKCAEKTRDNEGKTETYFSMDFDNVLSGSSYIWHIKVENNGDVDANVGMLIEKTCLSKNQFKCFSVCISSLFVDGDGNSLDPFLNFSEKKYLGNIPSPLADDVEFVSIFNDSESVKIGKSKEYLVKFTFESYDALIANEVSININDYNNLQNDSYLDEKIFFEVLLSSI